MSCKTRSELECPIFGTPKCLTKNVLPTYEDMNRYFNFVEFELKPVSTNPQQTAAKATKIVAKTIAEIWGKASIPIVLQSTIIKRISSYRLKIRNLLKPYKQRINVPSYQKKLQDFRSQSKVLFDVAACKCSDFDSCVCEKSFRVPRVEREFLLDQRGTRLMMIGSVDVTSTKVLQKRLERKELSSKVDSYASCSTSKVQSYANRSTSSKVESHASCSMQTKADSTSLKGHVEATQKAVKTPNNSEQQSTTASHSGPQISYNLLQLPVLARTLDRYGISDRAGAAVASAVLQDVGLINSEDQSSIIDKNKVRRARSKKREVIKTNTQTSLLRGLYFDGRKDETLSMEDGRRRKTREEHISLIKMHESVYLTHVTPDSGTSSDISKCILKYLNEADITTDNLRVIGCDGTNVNVGKHTGIIVNFEKCLNRPLHRFICQLHANELPLRHLINFLDGTTTGPKGFSGPIGQALNGCESLSIANFKIIETNLPVFDESVINDLSTDQKYLMDICGAISKGIVDEKLAKRNPGKIVHSRWLTTANRILRLYVSTAEPSDNLTILTTFILKVYGPMWFIIKSKPSCVQGAFNIWKMIQLSRYLPENLKAVVDPVILRNSYFAHPENILLGMLGDSRQHIRELAVRRIIKARSARSLTKHQKLWKFELLNSLRWDSAVYIDLIDWRTSGITEPPLTIGIPEDLLKEIIKNPDTPIISEIKSFPSHTQAVERAVKIVTEASVTVCGFHNRDGAIRAKLEPREIMPSFGSKQDYTI